MKFVHCLSLLAFTVTLGAAHVSTAVAAPADTGARRIQNQPHMQAALTALRAARDSLAKAEHDKGGWRTAALASTDRAITETVRGIAFDNHNDASLEPIALDAQPNMEAALVKLREAKAQLQQAEHDKGGWRAAAVAATETAITETVRGIAFANAH
jgi:hypothetical protein